jgi:hypothetical protein
VVVALGQLADAAWQTWRATSAGVAFNGVYTPVTHLTQPESSSKGTKRSATRRSRKCSKAGTRLFSSSRQRLLPTVPGPYSNLIEADAKDVNLTVVDGQFVYGNTAYLDRVKTAVPGAHLE